MSMSESTLHERLMLVVGTRTYRALGDLTGIHPETVRRYMQGQAPSIEFVSRLCASMRLNPEWMLLGKGPQKAADLRVETLRGADPSELLAAIAKTLEELSDRLTNVERFVQSLDTRLRGADDKIGVDVEGKPTPAQGEKARRIRAAVAQRAPADARGADACDGS